MDIVQKSFPQFMDETMTISIALKRQLQYKNSYQTGRVGVNIVMKGLKQLCSRDLYKVANITINEEWTYVLEQDSKKCMEETNFECESDMEMESNSEKPSETFVHGFIDSQCIHDLRDNIIEVAPVEGQHPLGIFMEKYAKEMNFPNLFYGNAHDDDIVKRLSYQKMGISTC